MKNLSSLFIELTLLMIGAVIWYPIYGQWQKHIIDDNLDYASGLSVADMNGDNKLDVVVSGYNENFIQWYAAPLWTKDVIGYLDGPDDLDVADINGDGMMDVVATSYSTGNIIWYEAPSWTEHGIDGNSNGAQHVKVTDLDGDNDLDVVATGRDVNDVRWYEAPSWTKHIIDSDLGGGRDLYVVDIDGDDTLDVVAAGMYANVVCWYKAPLWTKHIIDSNLMGAISVYVADIDGNSQLDVVAAGYNGNVVCWYEAPLWTKHIIDSNLGGARKVCIADLNGDDTLDVVATGMNSSTVCWYEAPSWTKNIIDSQLGGAYFMDVADMDKDNDLDVIATGSVADDVVWYEQEPVWVKTAEIFPKYLIPMGDTLFVKSHINNQENHSVSVYAKILGEEVSFSDSLVLYDDGLHFDENPNDNIWGNAKWLSGLEEDIYKVDIYIHDFSLGTNYKSNLLNYFTTIGPVVVGNYQKFDQSANFFKLKYDLRNDGLTDTATTVNSKVFEYDTNYVTDVIGTLYFPDIPPGQVCSTYSSFPHYIYTQNNPSSIDFIVHIFSNDHFFWSDTFTVIVTGIAEDETNLPIEYVLQQNYPNPFNPVTTIKYQVPELNFVTIKVYDLLGNEINTLVNEEKTAGTYEITWNAEGLPSGIYFYQLKAGDFVETKKMVLMK